MSCAYEKSLRRFTCGKSKPCGEGMSRRVFYSPTYKVIFKVARPDGSDRQSRREWERYNEVEAQYRYLFPILDAVEYEGKLVLVMPKCKCLTFHCEALTYWMKEELPHYIRNMAESNGYQISEQNVADLAVIIAKYKLNDLHYRNMGIWNGNLVILDWAW